MSPAKAAAKAAEIKAEGSTDTPSYTSLPLDPQEKGRFRRLVQQYTSLSEQISNLETLKDKIKGDLQEMMVKTAAETDVKSVMLDTYKVTLVSSETRTLKRELLLQQGVSVAQLEAATVTSSKLYVKVTDTAK